jgi:carbonic anhydrase
MPTDENAGVDRRQFLHTAVAGVVAGMATHWGFWPARDRGRAMRAGTTRATALEELLAGNRRYAANQPTSTGQDLAARRERTLEKQEPFAAVLACADSRMPVELVFDRSIGEIFVVRVAGNIVTPEIIGSLEYATAVLGIRALLVLGHTHCGAVKAAMKADAVPGQISALYAHIRPAVDRSDGDAEKATEINARMQADLLRSSSTVIRQATTAAKLEVAAGVYDLSSGRVAIC